MTTINVKKKRLIWVSGYYSIINSIALLKQKNDSNLFENILVISVCLMNPRCLYDFARQFKDFDDIYSLLYSGKNHDIHKIIKYTKYTCFDEILLPYPNLYNKFLEEGITTDCLIISDEGLATYEIMDKFLKYNLLDISEAYLLDKNLLNININDHKTKIYSIDLGIYKSIIQKLDQDLFLKNNSVVFLSSHSPFLEHPKAYNQKDIDIIKILISKGYNVYYKPHPRNYLREINELKDIINNDNFYIIDPLENKLIELVLFYNKDKIKFILSEGSSVLFHSYQIYGIPAFSYNFEDTIRSYDQIIRVLKYIPDFYKFLESNLSSIEFYIKSIDCLSMVRSNFNKLGDIISNLEKEANNNDILLLEREANNNDILLLERKIRKVKKNIRVLRFFLFLTMLFLVCCFIYIIK